MNEQRQDDGTMVLILGLVSAVFVLVGPAAVILGHRAMAHLPVGSQQYNHARTGWIIGWIASASMVLSLLLVGGWFALLIGMAVLGQM